MSDKQLNWKCIEEDLKKNGFKRLKPTGEGTYGKVVSVKSAKHRKRVAIKIIDLKRMSELYKKEFLTVEIELMRTITRHKNVIKFYEVIESTDDHLLYISMKFCPNGDLVDYLMKRLYIPEREACLWFKQLINGVQHIHKNGFAHRDLKPENLLLDHKYNIKITDFGFCCKLQYQRINASMVEIPCQTNCGSILYASPELLMNAPYLPTMSDIWSCGIILYTMLFGYYPYDGTELEKFIERGEHCIEAPIDNKVSKECKELVKNILVDENNRYSIEDIKKSKWFNTKWDPIDINTSNDEYYENLNIKRIETLDFDYTPITPTESVSSDDSYFD